MPYWPALCTLFVCWCWPVLNKSWYCQQDLYPISKYGMLCKRTYIYIYILSIYGVYMSQIDIRLNKVTDPYQTLVAELPTRTPLNCIQYWLLRFQPRRHTPSYWWYCCRTVNLKPLADSARPGLFGPPPRILLRLIEYHPVFSMHQDIWCAESITSFLDRHHYCVLSFN